MGEHEKFLRKYDRDRKKTVKKLKKVPPGPGGLKKTYEIIGEHEKRARDGYRRSCAVILVGILVTLAGAATTTGRL